MLGIIIELGTPVIVLQSQLALLVIGISFGRQWLMYLIWISVAEFLVWTAIGLPSLMMVLFAISIMVVYLRSSLPSRILRIIHRLILILITMRSHIQLSLTLYMALFIIIPLNVVERLKIKRIMVPSLLRCSRLINLN